jgi:hypothetical protein
MRDLRTVVISNIQPAETYSESKVVLVHVWETCRDSVGFRLVKCNCSALFPKVSAGSHSAEQCGIDLGRVSHLTGGVKATHPTAAPPQYLFAQPKCGYEYATAQPMAAGPQLFPPHSMYGYDYATAQFYNTPAIDPGYAPPIQLPVDSANTYGMPVYSANTYGLPVNVRDGAILTEARGIFISNLSYDCTLEDLFSILLTVGNPVDYKLFKGFATATFRSQDLAQDAADNLNKVEHMGKTLNVRMDKETTPVGQTGPLIVASDMCKVRSMCTIH